MFFITPNPSAMAYKLIKIIKKNLITKNIYICLDMIPAGYTFQYNLGTLFNKLIKCYQSGVNTNLSQLPINKKIF